MIKINFRNGIDNELAEIIDNNNINLTCTEDMNILVSEADLKKLIELAPAIEDDIYEVED